MYLEVERNDQTTWQKESSMQLTLAIEDPPQKVSSRIFKRMTQLPCMGQVVELLIIPNMFQSADISDQRPNIPYSLKVNDKHQNIITIKQNSDYLILVLLSTKTNEKISTLY